MAGADEKASKPQLNAASEEEQLSTMYTMT